MIPAVIVAIVVGVVAVAALALDGDRRNYALDLAETCTGLAAVLVGAPVATAEPGPGLTTPGFHLDAAAAHGRRPAECA